MALVWSSCNLSGNGSSETIFSIKVKQEKVLAIQPLGPVSSGNLDSVAHAIQRYYEVDVKVLPRIDLPPHTFTHVKSPRYRADKLLRWLKENKDNQYSHILAVTAKDISTTKYNPDGSIKKPISRYQDWGVFGLGYKPGCCSVISDFRLKHPKDHIRLERLKKVALHEFGHNLGLPHCESEQCVMKDAAESIRTIDSVIPALCAACKAKI